MSTLKVLTAAAVAGALSTGSVVEAAMAVGGEERSSTSFNYTQIRNATTADASAGFGNQSANASENPAYAFVDWFNDSDYGRFNNVSLALGANEYLALPLRADNGVHNVQVRLYAPGSSYAGTPLATFDSSRFRGMGFGGGRTAWQYVPVAAGLTGSYDIEVASLGGRGSHWAGLGKYIPANIVTAAGGAGNVLTAEEYDYGSGGKGFQGQTGGSLGRFLDNQFTTSDGTNFIDYDLSVADGGLFTASAHYRHDMGRNIGLTLSLVDADGDVVPLTSMALPDLDGWSTNFVWSAASGQFTLPSGFQTLRVFSDGPVHFSGLELTAAAVPEPTSLALVALGSLALTARRRRA